MKIIEEILTIAAAIAFALPSIAACVAIWHGVREGDE